MGGHQHILGHKQCTSGDLLYHILTSVQSRRSKSKARTECCLKKLAGFKTVPWNVSLASIFVTMLWLIRFVKSQLPDGSEWRPDKTTVLPSEHF